MRVVEEKICRAIDELTIQLEKGKTLEQLIPARSRSADIQLIKPLSYSGYYSGPGYPQLWRDSIQVFDNTICYLLFNKILCRVVDSKTVAVYTHTYDSRTTVSRERALLKYFTGCNVQRVKVQGRWFWDIYDARCTHTFEENDRVYYCRYNDGEWRLV